MKSASRGDAARRMLLTVALLPAALVPAAGPARAEGPSTAESQALLDLTVALCSRALPGQAADFEKTRRPPFTCMDVSEAQVRTVRQSAPYQAAFRRLAGELGSMPLPERLAWCHAHLTARCLDEPPPASGGASDD